MRRTEARRETLICLGLLTLVCAAVFGPHLFRGGFYSDDWANDATYAFSPQPRLTHAVETIQDTLGSRPLLAVAVALPHAVFGAHPAPHIALALVLAVAAGLCLYLVLTELGVEAVHAGAVAALALIFPWADSTRLWATAGINEVAVICFLAGLLLALRGLRASGRRAAAIHIGALALYLASIFTYEVAGAAIVLSGALYLTRAPRRIAVRLWALDAGVAIAALAVALALTTGVRPVPTLSGRIGDLGEFAGDYVRMLLGSFLPGVPKPLAAVAIAGVAALVIARLMKLAGPRRANAERWLVRAGVATGFLAAGSVMLLGSGLHPLSEGGANRGNIFIALPFTALVWFLAMAAVTVLLSGQRVRFQPVVTVAVLALVAAGYVARVYGDESDWSRAHDLQDRALATLGRSVPRPAAGTTVYLLGVPSQVAPHVPVFDATYDFDGALRLLWHEPRDHGYPVYAGVGIACGGSSLHPTLGDEFGPAQGARYGSALFVDGSSGRWRRIDSQAECTSALRQFPPGPRTAA
ncbi:MAG: hypothetical protein ACJ76V_00875 [Thermoleophilaceae bacterium]